MQSPERVFFRAYGSDSSRKLVSLVSRMNLSIRQKIAYSFVAVILMMGLLNVAFMVRVLQYQRQYDTILNNIATANSLNGSISSSMSTELWRITTGNVSFSQGRQYQIIDTVNQRVEQMIANTDSRRGKLKLEVVQRTMGTLKRSVDQMGTLVQTNAGQQATRDQLDQVLWVAGLVEADLQDYMIFDVLSSQRQYTQIREGFQQWILFNVVALVGLLIFSATAAWVISESIYVPIKKLHDVTSTITENDLEVLLRGEHMDEIAELGIAFNIMIERINNLLTEKIKEQENLAKAELRTLQAQITPHFLYNTLDTIVWLAEMGKTQQVVDMVKALSDFFRIGLSKGQDWITLRDEVRHTESYLTIQQIRYRDILNFEIDIDDSILDSMILKLTLQPLVENALYHGIKGSRGGGKISVVGRKLDGRTIQLEVTDNGAGFTKERLAQILAELGDDAREPHQKESGFGLDNVNRRVRLYYGKEYSLAITSQRQKGTCVSLTIPLVERTAITAAP